MAKIILSKTFTDRSPPILDDKCNEFRRTHKAIATSCDSQMIDKDVLFIQTIFYTEE